MSAMVPPEGRPYIVGENRPELFRPVTISFAKAGDALFDGLLEELRKYIQVPPPEQDGGSADGS